MSREDEGLPEFAVSLRGYDREQVDDYIRTLRAFLAEAQQRALASEAAGGAVRGRRPDTAEAGRCGTAGAADGRGPARIGTAADPVAGISERVATSVQALLSAAEHTAGQLLEEARAERESARHEARRLAEEAQAERVRQIAAAEERLQSLRQQADQEQARRRQVLRQVASLRSALAAAAEEDADWQGETESYAEPVDLPRAPTPAGLTTVGARSAGTLPSAQAAPARSRSDSDPAEVTQRPAGAGRHFDDAAGSARPDAPTLRRHILPVADQVHPSSGTRPAPPQSGGGGEAGDGTLTRPAPPDDTTVIIHLPE